MHSRIAEDEKLAFIYDRIELPLIPVLWRMERNGVLLDRARLEAQSQELGKEIWRWSRRPMKRPASPSTSARRSKSRRSCSSARSCR